MKIECGIFNRKLFILLLYPIFNIIECKVILKNASNLYRGFTKSIGCLSAGLVYLLILYRSGKVKKLPISVNNELKTSAINEIYEEKQQTIKKRKIKKLASIFKLSLLNMMPMVVKIIFIKLQLNDVLSESLRLLSGILFFAFFSKIFLNSKIYRHQSISLYTIYFCLLIVLFIDIRNIENFDLVNFIISLLYFIVLYIFYALYGVLVKKHFETELTNPYYLMFLVGLFNFILIIPLDLFICIYNDPNLFGLDIINQIINLYDATFVLLFIFDIINVFLWITGIILTLYYYTPCHIIIALIFIQFISKCIKLIKNEEKNEWYIVLAYSVLYGIIFFSGLVYNELVIIHLFSMEKNTVKYISSRQRLESESLQNNYDENLATRDNISATLLKDEDI